MHRFTFPLAFLAIAAAVWYVQPGLTGPLVGSLVAVAFAAWWKPPRLRMLHGEMEYRPHRFAMNAALPLVPFVAIELILVMAHMAGNSVSFSFVPTLQSVLSLFANLGAGAVFLLFGLVSTVLGGS